MGPRSGAVVREAARGLAGGRPLFLTLTHFHPEHGYGAQAFGEAATIIYNREQHEEFLQKARPYLDMFRGLGSEVAEQLEGVEFVDPHVAYEGAADLDLGGKVVQLRTWGAAHSRGDQTVYLPDERVLFTGDLVVAPVQPCHPRGRTGRPADPQTAAAELGGGRVALHGRQHRVGGRPRRRPPVR